MPHFSLFFTLSSIIFLQTTLSSTVSPTTSTTLGKDQVPGILCDCEVPPSPPPPKECPPPIPPSPPPPIPPSPPPPIPPSPPPPILPSPPPPYVECPPPPIPVPLPALPPTVYPLPKPPCGGGGIECYVPTLPPPKLPYPTEIPGTINLDDISNGANMIRPPLRYLSLHSFTFLLLLCLPYCFFI